MTDSSDRLAALAGAHAERAIACLAAVIDTPGVTAEARIDAARVLLGFAAGRLTQMQRPVQIDWAEPGAGAPAAEGGNTWDRKHGALNRHCPDRTNAGGHSPKSGVDHD